MYLESSVSELYIMLRYLITINLNVFIPAYKFYRERVCMMIQLAISSSELEMKSVKVK
jgi:hypothetical protein